MPLRPERITARAVIPMLAGLLIATPAFAGNFTAEQAAAGQQAYNSNCAQCHGRQLEGPDAPGLAGQDVMGNWDSAGGLYDFISVAMPPSAPGLLGEETYVNIVAYIMQFNGAVPDDTPLTTDRDYAVSLVAETSAGAASQAAAALDAGGAAAAPAADAAPAEETTAVPQAYTWGTQLPGGAAPAAPAATEPATPASTVPQAYTWGQQLPAAGAN
ncbi:c-type cytochrome [Devosia rhizoryzae]|uniref:Cytochrome c n=1 Tax=Devosia rhizoryzae TaxID=2774137 RepID=A0ABX7C8W7_9HYPH|nr:cytochrome c [Devosia rhizoryzae]QQR39654.1 cytochrome c [Devosia rhizoryzae]